jgi:hypothetical protein
MKGGLESVSAERVLPDLQRVESGTSVVPSLADARALDPNSSPAIPQVVFYPIVLLLLLVCTSVQPEQTFSSPFPSPVHFFVPARLTAGKTRSRQAWEGIPREPNPQYSAKAPGLGVPQYTLGSRFVFGLRPLVSPKQLFSAFVLFALFLVHRQYPQPICGYKFASELLHIFFDPFVFALSPFSLHFAHFLVIFSFLRF